MSSLLQGQKRGGSDDASPGEGNTREREALSTALKA